MASTRELHYQARFFDDAVLDEAERKLHSIAEEMDWSVLRTHPKKGDRVLNIKPFVSAARRSSENTLDTG